MNIKVCSDSLYSEAEVEIDGVKLRSSGRDSGCSRSVYLFDEFVLKTQQRYLGGDTQNEAEIRFYTVLEDCDAQYFPKLLAHGITDDDKSFLVQERVEIDLYQPPTPLQQEILKGLLDKYRFGDVEFLTVGSNWSCYNNNVTPVGGCGLKIWDIGAF